jgi:hypothetical protein
MSCYNRQNKKSERIGMNIEELDNNYDLHDAELVELTFKEDEIVLTFAMTFYDDNRPFCKIHFSKIKEIQLDNVLDLFRYPPWTNEMRNVTVEVNTEFSYFEGFFMVENYQGVYATALLKIKSEIATCNVYYLRMNDNGIIPEYPYL